MAVWLFLLGQEKAGSSPPRIQIWGWVQTKKMMRMMETIWQRSMIIWMPWLHFKSNSYIVHMILLCPFDKPWQLWRNNTLPQRMSEDVRGMSCVGLRQRHRIGNSISSGDFTQLWKLPCFNAKTHYTWPCSMVMWNYQRGSHMNRIIHVPAALQQSERMQAHVRSLLYFQRDSIWYIYIYIYVHMNA